MSKQLLFCFGLLFYVAGCRASAPKKVQQQAKPFSKITKPEEPKVSSLPDVLPRKKGGIQPGRYLGYFKNSNREVSHPLIIDLIPYGYTKRRVKLRGVVKILNDGYASHEYQSQYFIHVDYIRNSQKLIFKNRDTVFNLKNVGVHGEVIQGQLVTAQNDTLGNFIAKWQPPGDTNTSFQTLLTEFPVEDNLTGFYKAKCGGKTELLSITSSPSFIDKNQSAESWSISAKEHTLKSAFCQAESCATVDFTKGSFTSETGQLTLKSKNKTLTCTKQIATVRCDNQCNYMKTKESISSVYRASSRKYAKVKEPKIDQPTPSQIIGTYYGFLHHETRNQYQLTRLQVNHTQNTHEKFGVWDYLNGEATLFFGTSTSREFIAHKFLPRRFVAKRKVFIFDGPGESFLTVTGWAENSVQGIWYSKNFGRVGTFQLSKNKIPPISKFAKIIPRLEGTYKAPDKSIQLTTRSMPTTNNWDIYPINILGLRENTSTSEKNIIVGGKYDLYSATLRLNTSGRGDAVSYFKNDGKTLVFPSFHRKTNEVVVGEYTKSEPKEASVASSKEKTGENVPY